MRLLVSQDLGVTYKPVQEGSLEELSILGEQYDIEMLRWVILDEDENIVQACKILNARVGAVLEQRAATGRPVMMVTEDQYLTKLLRDASFTLGEFVARMQQEKKGLH